MVGQTMMRIVRPCFKPSLSDAQVVGGGAGVGTRDGLLWYKDTGRHACGDFSMAVVQANNLLEDGSQVEAGPFVAEGGAAAGPRGTFVGAYDGHGGPETARSTTDTLLQWIQKRFAAKQQTASFEVIRKTDVSTEVEFLNLVRKQWLIKQQQIASVVPCCLVGATVRSCCLFGEGVLYIANVDDSLVRTPKISRRDQQAETRQDVAHKTRRRDTGLNRKTGKR